MWLAAQVAGHIELAAQLGFEVGAPKFDWCEFITHRQRYITNIHASYRRRLDESGIVTVAARGRLIDARTVECADGVRLRAGRVRSEEHTSELQSIIRISYAVFCLKKKKHKI